MQITGAGYRKASERASDFLFRPWLSRVLISGVFFFLPGQAGTPVGETVLLYLIWSRRFPFIDYRKLPSTQNVCTSGGQMYRTHIFAIILLSSTMLAPVVTLEYHSITKRFSQGISVRFEIDTRFQIHTIDPEVERHLLQKWKKTFASNC